MTISENLPTIENLKGLYNSTFYQDLLVEFEKRSKHKLENAEVDLLKYLKFIQKRFIILKIPFERVLLELDKLREKLLEFTIRSINFFAAEEGITEGESLEEEEGGVSRTFLLDKFCEAYLLERKDSERLLRFLQETRMPYAEQYLKQIEQLYFVD